MASALRLNNSNPMSRPASSFKDIIRAILPNEINWTYLELEAGCIVWSIPCLGRNLFHVPFHVNSDHQALESRSNVGEYSCWIQRCLEFLTYQFKPFYRRSSANTNTDFLSRLSQPLAAADYSAACRLPYPRKKCFIPHPSILDWVVCLFYSQLNVPKRGHPHR